MVTFSMFSSILFLVTVTVIFTVLLMTSSFLVMPSKSVHTFTKSLFPLENISSILFIMMFVLMGLLNLVSLVCFSYPVTTTLSFNLSFASMLWFVSILMMVNKENSFGSLLPSNSPSYLISFLSVVELVSISVRPITLCFRLLANMSAGHILLSLICKLPYFTWLLGSLFGMLELLVSLVQSFVFLMLISVYMEEGYSH